MGGIIVIVGFLFLVTVVIPCVAILFFPLYKLLGGTDTFRQYMEVFTG